MGLQILTFKEHAGAETQNRDPVEDPAGLHGVANPWACQVISEWSQEGAHRKC